MEQEIQLIQNSKIRSESLRYGLYLGLIAILITLGVYLIDATLLASFKVGGLSLVVFIVFLVIAMRNIRNSVGGYWDFRQAFVSCFIILAVSAVIGQIFVYILHNFIDPTLSETLKTAVINQTEGMLAKFGTPQDKIDEALKEIEKKDMSVTFKSTVVQLGGTLVFYAIISLIMGAVLKKAKPMFDAQ
ncbi:DUF4199 domain-containing protein [Solitalea lacus]|uniref:DUF4199 domain-containing protein n=1 Tax=Solitalea lacus TaxID=2911172 RepID=UPI001EDAFBB2|nr:DUF4199 domain-containing protein [Solitalea lacus]UKJ05768.1 DUF4199 domain-containing protein [Solitalea lacus]